MDLAIPATGSATSKIPSCPLIQAIIPVVPTKSPQLGKATYDTILNHFLLNDKPQLLATINTWPSDIYDLQNITSQVRSELDAVRTDTVLLEVMGEL
jgi:hypothetical protein